MTYRPAVNLLLQTTDYEERISKIRNCIIHHTD